MLASSVPFVVFVIVSFGAFMVALAAGLVATHTLPKAAPAPRAHAPHAQAHHTDAEPLVLDRAA